MQLRVKPSQSSISMHIYAGMHLLYLPTGIPPGTLDGGKCSNALKINLRNFGPSCPGQASDTSSCSTWADLIDRHKNQTLSFLNYPHMPGSTGCWHAAHALPK
eukprot:1161226-Pelagomonas_calceolata.AAC.4